MWIDGETDEGELATLDEAGVASISLAAEGTATDVAGNTVWRNGSFTTTDGNSGEYAEVSFDVAPETEADTAAAAALSEEPETDYAAATAVV